MRPDKSLNYGRDIIQEYGKSIESVESCLDVGAGKGSDLKLIKVLHPQAHLHGLEVYGPNIEELKNNNITPHSLNFESEKLPFESESLDLIISNQMMEHSKEIFWVMHEIARTLKVEGHLILGIPNLASLHNRFLLLLGRQPTCINNSSAHVRGFTKHDLLRFVQIFPDGLQLKQYRGSNFYPFPAFIAKPLAKIFPSMAWSNFLLIQKTRAYDKNYYLEFPRDQQLETNFFLG